MYYAINSAYGLNMLENGRIVGEVFGFESKSLRDKFVEAGSTYTTERGARLALPATSPEVRKAKADDHSITTGDAAISEAYNLA